MRARRAVVCLALVACGAVGTFGAVDTVDTVLRARTPQSDPAAFLVALDAIVTDDSGKPVTGLSQADFQVKDDGKPVELKTFDEVRADGGRPVARSIVLLLDDSGLGPGNTLPIQQIARTFVARMEPPDEFSVIRLNNRRDEAFGDRLEALLRIDEYRSDTVPFFGEESLENALRAFGKVSRTLEAIEHRRKALVCIGVPAVCRIREPGGRSSLLWRFWTDAVSAMARSNASLYSLEPNGVPNRDAFGRGSIEDITGGDVFSNMTELTRPIDIVRRDTGNYYLLGYWPASSDKPLHAVEVKVAKRGVHVRARRLRGAS